MTGISKYPKKTVNIFSKMENFFSRDLTLKNNTERKIEAIKQ